MATLPTKLAQSSIIIVLFLSGLVWAERLAVHTSTANVRSGPGTNHDVIWKIEKNHPIVVIKKSNEWFQFKDFEQDKGWISKSLVKKMPTVITKKDKCNVRTGPGKKYDTHFVVDKGIPFKVLQRKDKWINIKHADGDEGWIYHSLVW